MAILDRYPSLIPRGNGRAYGDAALNTDCVLETLRSDRILAFDTRTGTIQCEAGLLLADLLAFSIPRGFFPPVTPGTKFVTIGGMVAADVHGKNHGAAGSFSRHVESLEMMLADGRAVSCSPQQEAELFWATCGGMGLTGLILTASFRLIRVETGMIRQRAIKTGKLDETMALMESESTATYSVAWVDALSDTAHGRAVVYLGEHAKRDEVRDAGLTPPPPVRLSVPCDLPSFLLNHRTARLFATAYYNRASDGSTLIPYDRYFYPLDALGAWNRCYGAAGFLQYQCVVPRAAGRMAIGALLDRIKAAGEAAFLAVLKLFGAADPGYLSFPMEGYTLALDFPAKPGIPALLAALDEIVAGAGGRLYLAKDARSGPEMLHGYPMLSRFRAVREAVDPHHRFASAQSIRLGL
ncbi:MAG TPA: FAD-binding oxidoreductase [Aliidongia sp.]|nr:FAD-binding oxidoreductase [Aliidongia sp.]